MYNQNILGYYYYFFLFQLNFLALIQKKSFQASNSRITYKTYKHAFNCDSTVNKFAWKDRKLALRGR